MPLYETIVIARAGAAKGSVNLMKQMSKQIFELGGNVRNIEVLGDRVLTRQIKGLDQKKHLVGRYLQVLYDGAPNTKQALEHVTKGSYEALQVKTFKVKDFYSDAQMFRKTLENSSQIDINSIKNKEYVEKLQNIQQENQMKKQVKNTQKNQIV